MASVYFITHPDVVIDPSVPVTDWPLSEHGRQRMRGVLRFGWSAGIGALWSSTERKARDAAAILSGALGLCCSEMAELGENDRIATGYLPREEFEAVADTFFANPETSVRGWERAVDAQARIVNAVTAALALSPTGVDVAIVSHGGVGSLLLCHLRGGPISRLADQPGGGGGNYFIFERGSWAIGSGWLRIDSDAVGP